MRRRSIFVDCSDHSILSFVSCDLILSRGKARRLVVAVDYLRKTYAE
jgi:hypothetical protein